MYLNVKKSNAYKKWIETEDFSMKKKVTIVVALALALVMSLSVSLADCAYTEYTIPSVGGRDFIIRNGISDYRRDAYAKTSGGTNSYNTVTANFVYENYVTHQTGEHHGNTQSSYISVQVNAPTLSYMQNNRYCDVYSDHSGSYNGGSFSYNNLHTSVD